MSSIDKLAVRGIRSFSPFDEEKIEFYKPLTLILGQNGAGKTVIYSHLYLLSVDYYWEFADYDLWVDASSYPRWQDFHPRSKNLEPPRDQSLNQAGFQHNQGKASLCHEKFPAFEQEAEIGVQEAGIGTQGARWAHRPGDIH